jgi:DNA-binding NtrC family response regulator
MQKERKDQLFDRIIDEFIIGGEMSLKKFLSRVEINLLVLMLQKSKGNQREASKILGIKHTSLNEKMKRYNISLHKFPVFDESEKTEEPVRLFSSF